ncbi:MAG: metallophosphoesterase [Verrucomicrobiota bacterium]
MPSSIACQQREGGDLWAVILDLDCAPPPIRVVSDLHLGHPKSRIGGVEGWLPLTEGAGTVLFNGDTWEGRVKERAHLASRAKLEQLQAALARRGVQALFLEGNHDPFGWEHSLATFGAGQVVVTHGHAVLEEVSPWSREVIWQREALRSLGPEGLPASLDPLLRRLQETRARARAIKPLSRERGMGFRLWQRFRPDRQWQIFLAIAQGSRRAMQFLQHFAPEARVMLSGHTHWASVFQQGSRSIVNTGAFTVPSRSLVVDLQGSLVRVREVERAGGEFRLGRDRAEIDLD